MRGLKSEIPDPELSITQLFSPEFELFFRTGASALLSHSKSLKTATSSKADELDMLNTFYWGIIPCLIASLLSGVASGLSQVALQGLKRNSFVFTMELAMFSISSVVCAEVAGRGGTVCTTGTNANIERASEQYHEAQYYYSIDVSSFSGSRLLCMQNVAIRLEYHNYPRSSSVFRMVNRTALQHSEIDGCCVICITLMRPGLGHLMENIQREFTYAAMIPITTNGIVPRGFDL